MELLPGPDGLKQATLTVSAAGDAWVRFTVPFSSQFQVIDIDGTSGGVGNSADMVYSGSCGSLVPAEEGVDFNPGLYAFNGVGGQEYVAIFSGRDPVAELIACLQEV